MKQSLNIFFRLFLFCLIPTVLDPANIFGKPYEQRLEFGKIVGLGIIIHFPIL